MKLTPVEFSVEGVPFRVTFAVDQDYVRADLHALEDAYQLLASVLSMAWKLDPVNLLEGILDGRPVSPGEFFTISYNDDPDDPDPIGVNLYEDDRELNLSKDFFKAVVLELAFAHLDLVGEDHFPWLPDLSPEARKLLD